ncbi:MAG TPA: stage II sporulation protein M [Myxococcota bacterium]
MTTTTATAAPSEGLDLERDRSARLWTPERVPLTLPLAGLGERALAYLIDLGVLVAAAIAGLFVYNWLWGDLSRDVSAMSGVASALAVLIAFAVAVLFDVICETLFAGRTLGKRALKLRVLTAKGRTPDFFTALLRNAVRIIDILPFGYAVGTVTVFLTGTRRLGDLVADTFVVTERSRRRDPLALCRAVADDPLTPTPRVSDDDALRALAMIERTHRLDRQLAGSLCARMLKRIDPLRFAEVSVAEARAMLARTCLALAEEKTSALAQVARLVDAERALADALAQLVPGSSADVVERTDAAIRRAASELMRAARKDLPARHLESLSLALLDAERRRVIKEPAGRVLRRYFLRDVPRTVFLERKLIARSAAVLALGLVVGGVVAYADAGVARFLVGDDVATLVEHGALWTDDIERKGAFAATSAQIIINNVGVGVRVFAFGLLGGVATILALLSNGLQIGATFGYAFRLGTAGTLLRFICAHGPVELTMIAIAGAAGMCLGRALLSPGPRTRMHALREEGARGIRLLAAASIGFLCIGTVEGFISPGRMFPTPVNAAIGVTLWCLFWLFIYAFGRDPPSSPSAPPSAPSSPGRPS